MPPPVKSDDIKIRATAGMVLALDRLADLDPEKIMDRSKLARKAIKAFLLQMGFKEEEIEASSVPDPKSFGRSLGAKTAKKIHDTTNAAQD